MSLLTTAIDLIDPGTVKEVHLSVFRPGVQASSCTIDGGQIAFFLIRPYWRGDVHMGVERTTLTVVTTIDFTSHTSFFAGVVVIHIRLIHITRRKHLRTECPAEDILNING